VYGSFLRESTLQGDTVRRGRVPCRTAALKVATKNNQFALELPQLGGNRQDTWSLYRALRGKGCGAIEGSCGQVDRAKTTRPGCRRTIALNSIKLRDSQGDDQGAFFKEEKRGKKKVGGNRGSKTEESFAITRALTKVPKARRLVKGSNKYNPVGKSSH